MNTQRRIFRGRGGPTDGRLPKHNARRRRAPGAHKPAVNKYQEEDNDHAANTTTGGDTTIEVANVKNGKLDDAHSSSSNNSMEDPHMEAWHDDESDVDSMEDSVTAPKVPTAGERNQEMGGMEGSSPIIPVETNKNPCLKEVEHLRRRVRNIRETMMLSNSISNPATYQNNVLNAVSNCVNEWRSIATHYPLAPENETERDSDQTYMSPEMKKLAALNVFEMIQHAIQCGPLAGAKPGYFKRCGSAVAKVAETFLEEVIPHSPALLSCMGFTRKQMDAMETWKKNAHKAVLEDKPPSRTAVIHQAGKGTGKKAKKKQEKG